MSESKKKIAFWNIQRKHLDRVVSSLVVEKEIDLLILCEPPKIEEREDFKRSLLERLNEHGENSTYSFVENRQNRFVIIKKNTFPQCRESREQLPGSRSCFLSISTGPTFLMCITHGPDKSNNTELDLINFFTDLNDTITDVEDNLKTRNTIIVGDLNVNPFEKALTNSRGINSSRCPIITNQCTKVVKGARKEFFYNPSWHFLFKNNLEAHGTYHYYASSEDYRWNVFDQVLVRKQVIEKFDLDSLNIVLRVGNEDLRKATGKPNTDNYSDHFPLCFKIDFS